MRTPFSWPCIGLRIDDVLHQAGDLVGQGDPHLLVADECRQYRARDRAQHLRRRGACEESSRRQMSSARLTRYRAKCFLASTRRGTKQTDRAWSIAATTCAQQRCRGRADPRRGVRTGRRRPVADRPLHRAVRAARGPARLRGRRRPGTGVPLRAVRGLSRHDARARQMGRLLRDRRLGCGRADRIAVRRHDAHCRAAGAASGRGRRRVRDADDRSFRRRFAVVGASACAVARRSSPPPFFAASRPRRSGVRRLS